MVTVAELAAMVPLKVVAGSDGVGGTVKGGYVADLLSHVMGQARAGDIWVTLQGHKNIVAVASLVGLSAVVVAGAVEPDYDTLHQADQEAIPVLTTELSVFEVAGRLYGVGLKGL